MRSAGQAEVREGRTATPNLTTAVRERRPPAGTPLCTTAVKYCASFVSLAFSQTATGNAPQKERLARQGRPLLLGLAPFGNDFFGLEGVCDIFKC